MPKKHKCPPTGAPEWMMTYGDMMTLLLCFFVLIVSFSEIKTEERWQSVVEHLRIAFGNKGGGGKLDTRDDPSMSFVELAEEMSRTVRREPKRSQTTDPGQDGPNREVTRVREGRMFTVGGRVMFEPGSAQLTPDAIDSLRSLLPKVRGLNTLVELRGHATIAEVSGGDPNAGGAQASGDAWTLSYSRAKAVLDFMTGPEGGMAPDRFRLTANAEREPLIHRGLTPQERAPNRRVEVFMSESVIDDFIQPETSTD